MKDKKTKVLTWIALLLACVGLNIILLHRLPIRESSYLKVGCCMLVLEGMGIWYLLVDDKQYKADMIPITPDIKTPAPAGQGQHGTARWLKEKEYDRVFSSCVIDRDTTEIERGGLVIGKKNLKGDREKVYFIKDFVHSLTIGATRSGKTRHEVLETIGLCGLAGESMVVTDIKGELYDYTAPFLREQGYAVYVMDYDEPMLSDANNPLQPVNDLIDADDIPAATDACWDIVSQLVGEAKGEKIWNNGECATIAGVIMAVCYDNRQPDKQKYRNMTNVYHFLVEMCTPIGKLMPIRFYLASLPEQHPCKAVMAVANIAPRETRGSFYTSALLTLRLFTNPYLYSITKESGYALEDFGKQKTALFIILPEDRKTYHSAATLFVTQIYSRLSRLAKDEGGVLPIPVNFICDEFGNFAKIPSFIQMLTVAGGKRIRWHLFLQDYAQLDDVYEREAAKTIRGNCEIKVYLRSADPDTREIISKDLGKYTTKGYSLSYNRHRAENSSSNTNLVGRELLTGDEVGRIRRPYSLVMSSNYPAILYAPDLSQWSFNERFGMGDEAHNASLRQQRHEKRPVHPAGHIDLWGIWKNYQRAAKNELKRQAEKKQAEAGGNEE